MRQRVFMLYRAEGVSAAHANWPLCRSQQ